MSSCWIVRSKIALGLLASLIAFSAFCSSDRKTNPKDDEDTCICPQEEAELLDALAGYCEERDLECYGSTLCEGFVFCFTEDVAESLGLPSDDPCWGKTDDVEATENMFDDSAVRQIEVDYTRLTDWRPCYDEREDTTYAGLCCRLRPDIRVTVHEEGEWPVTLWVNDSWLDVMIVSNPLAEECWCFVRITEMRIPGQVSRRGEASAVIPTTWGAIKSMWD